MFKFLRRTRQPATALSTLGPYGPIELAQIDTREIELSEQTIMVKRAGNRYTIGEATVISDEALTLSPMMLDRPYLYRLDNNYTLPAHGRSEEVFYLPLMASFNLAVSRRSVYRTNAHPCALAWFGTNTMDGQLCYTVLEATRRNDFFVPVKVRFANKSAHSITLEKIAIPCQFMKLYQSSDSDGFATDDIRVVIDDDQELSYNIERKSPDQIIADAHQLTSGIAFKRFLELVSHKV